MHYMQLQANGLRPRKSLLRSHLASCAPDEKGVLACRFVVVCGDGEYIIYTAMALRNKAFGSALEFTWANDSSE